ncbi:Peroxisomal membrane anchor protein (Pex14p) conserved region domain containing protein [Hyaloscypha variabilis]
MSDSDPGEKKAGVPSWQLKTKEESTKKEDKPAPESPSRATIIEQAKKFLEEDEVRNASIDKKVTFLESKGLQSEEIQALLGVTKNTEASSETPRPQPTQSSPPPPSSPRQQAPSQPPIITYPEFLTTPTSPTPLITKTRLLTTLYLFSGLSALLYGTNTYLLTPMLATLTESRLSLASTTSSNLTRLITRLESMVSEIPPTIGHAHQEHKDSDSESDEDPTELFHRDIGVQTSPPASESGARPTSPTPNSALADQTSRLKSLTESLNGLVEDSTSEGHDVVELEATIGVLKEYLEGMAFVVPNYSFGGVGGSGFGAREGKEADDEIGRVKMAIKSMKGVLLSARSFPSGVRGVGR